MNNITFWYTQILLVRSGYIKACIIDLTLELSLWKALETLERFQGFK